MCPFPLASLLKAFPFFFFFALAFVLAFEGLVLSVELSLSSAFRKIGLLVGPFVGEGRGLSISLTFQRRRQLVVKFLVHLSLPEEEVMLYLFKGGLE